MIDASTTWYDVISRVKSISHKGDTFTGQTDSIWEIFRYFRISKNCHRICILGPSSSKLGECFKKNSRLICRLPKFFFFTDGPNFFQEFLWLVFSIQKFEVLILRYRTRTRCSRTSWPVKSLQNFMQSLQLFFCGAVRIKHSITRFTSQNWIGPNRFEKEKKNSRLTGKCSHIHS